MNKHLLLSRVRSMMEANMASLSANVDSGRKDRAKSIHRFFRKVDRNSQGHAVLEWDTETEGSGHRYKCYIAIEPSGATLFQLSHGAKKIRTAMDMIKSADVKCFCTCKDFRFSGAEYNMKHKYDSLEIDHSSNASSDMVPSVRDPEGKHTLCKHLYACFNGILTNASAIMKQTRDARFPAAQQQQPTAPLGQQAPQSNDSGTVTTMNGSNVQKAPDAGGQIKTFNGSDTPVREEPGDAKAITILGNSAPVEHTKEIGEALDSLALAMNSAATDNTAQDTSENGDITTFNSSEEPSGQDTESEITMMNGAEQPNGIFDMEDSLESGMFNHDEDEEEI